MDTSMGIRSMSERARDILKGIGLQPNAATVQYVTGELEDIVTYVVEFVVEELKKNELLKEGEISPSVEPFYSTIPC